MGMAHEGVNPKSVFANNELDLSKIDAWGFDYDYTLAVYTKELNNLIFWMALKRLVTKQKVRHEGAHTSCRPTLPNPRVHTRSLKS